MNREAHDAEQLNAALDAVAGGATPEEASVGLPAELQRLAETGDWFVRTGAAAGPRPRPSFVLGLEDQLRTDLRLRPAGQGQGAEDGDGGAQPAGPQGAATAALAFLYRHRVLGLALLGLLGFFALTQRALPGDALYGAKRLIERTTETLAPSRSMRANICLDRGWRRLEETEALLVGGSDSALLEQVLTDLVDDYRSALEYAAASDDERVTFRAATEVEATRERIDRLAANASPADSSLLVEAREALEEARMRHGISERRPRGPGSEPVAPTEAAVASSLPPVAGTASATAPGEATPTDVAGDPVGTEAPTASPTASATASPTARLVATATLPPPAASATPTATRTLVPPPDPTDRPKPKPPTRVPPTETPVPPETPTPYRTPDAWVPTETPKAPSATPAGDPGAGAPGAEPTREASPTLEPVPSLEPGGRG